MYRIKMIVVALALFTMVAVGELPQEPTSATGGESQAGEIKVSAKKYAFNPNVINVKKGEHVKLIITALDHDHGFKLDAFNINQIIKKGTSATIEFTADRAGTFHFHCSHFCGLGHSHMHGKLVVEEASDK